MSIIVQPNASDLCTISDKPPSLQRPQIAQLTFSKTSSEESSEDSPTTPSGRVRFRSRVRISSGNSRRYSHLQLRSSVDEQQGDERSNLHARFIDSNSSSRSSSISVPLRSRRGSEGESTPSTWPPLGKRIAMLASGRPEREMIQTERTPLIASQPVPHKRCVPTRIYSEEEEDAMYAAEINRLYGPFPGRLLNSAWWRWQLEPLCLCTACSGERGPYDLD